MVYFKCDSCRSFMKHSKHLGRFIKILRIVVDATRYMMYEKNLKGLVSYIKKFPKDFVFVDCRVQ